MLEWLEDIAGPNFATAVLWTFAALLLLVIVLVIVKLIRSLTFGTFVAGGRNRKTRLAVMDAAAVDSHRRLVLVRRDDVEHLILIGGPTDVVVERDIRLGQLRRPAMTGDTRSEPSAPQRPKPSEPAPAPVRAAPAQPVPVQPVRVQPAPPALAARPVRDTAPPPSSPRPAPARLQPEAAGPSPATLHTNAMSTTIRQDPLPQFAAQNSLDDALLKELEVTFDAGPPSNLAVPSEQQSVDDEMTKLLGELANHKR
jgi:hypothetical protein